jgi:hypothetical protein
MAVVLVLASACMPRTNRVAGAPDNLVATGDIATIGLSWSASIGATGYNVKRSTTSGGPYVQLASTGDVQFVDTSVAAGSIYFYVVSALAPDGESADSQPAFASLVSVPSAPAGLSATAGDGQVSLSWSPSDGADTYRVQRSTVSGGPYTLVTTTPETAYVDGSLTNGTTYHYVVSAVNRAGESTNSQQASAVPDVQNPPPTTFGTWTNVTPAGVDLTSPMCSNFGASSIQVDRSNPSHLYTLFHCQGVWKSTDYGVTWTGPLNTGTNGATFGDCSGGLTVAGNGAGTAPTIYASCIRGGGAGFWRSVDGGVNWTRHTVTPTTRQDYVPPVVDPYDKNHLLMAAHEFDSVVESEDGGVTWAAVPLVPGMLQGGRSSYVFFLDNGNATATRGTWLWMGEQAGGAHGTWRTTNSGNDWVRVDSNEASFGAAQIYQPDTSGVVYMAGVYSGHGWGVLRSRDFGQTWTRTGPEGVKSVVFGTSKNVYAMYGAPIGAGGVLNPAFQVAAQPGTGTWVSPVVPASLVQGPAQVAVTHDGTNSILVGAMWNGGVWRYVEP